MAEVKKVVTPPFVLSFPAVFEPKAFDGGTPKYGATAIFRPGRFNEQDKQRWRAMHKLLDEVSMARFKKAVKDLPGNFKKVPRDGEEKADLEGFGAGTKFANLTSKMRPGVVGLSKDADTGKYLPIGPEHGNADQIYPGCVCRATITAYAYDNKGKGVAWGLNNLQKIADGPRLDSRTDAADDFDGEEVDDSWVDEAEESVEADPLD